MYLFWLESYLIGLEMVLAYVQVGLGFQVINKGPLKLKKKLCEDLIICTNYYKRFHSI